MTTVIIQFKDDVNAVKPAEAGQGHLRATLMPKPDLNGGLKLFHVEKEKVGIYFLLSEGNENKVYIGER